MFLYDWTTEQVQKITWPYDKGEKNKNWSPFVYMGSLYLEYSIQPRIILRPKENGECFIANGHTVSKVTTRFQQRVGSMRGGPSSVYVPRHHLYLGIAHTTFLSLYYFHNFYTFEDKPPFTVTRVGRPMFMPFGFQPENYTKAKIQFVTGLLVHGDEVLVSYGEMDCMSRIARFSLKDILRDVR